MTTPILFLIAGSVGFATVIAVLFLHARKLSRESERSQSPDDLADALGIGGGEFFNHHGKAD